MQHFTSENAVADLNSVWHFIFKNEKGLNSVWHFLFKDAKVKIIKQFFGIFTLIFS
jgi:hypothetical protein